MLVPHDRIDLHAARPAGMRSSCLPLRPCAAEDDSDVLEIPTLRHVLQRR